MHPRLQAKLLRAIQEREIDRVGGGQPIKVNIRLLATSNRDLEASVANGSFREDLYFRLNVVNIQLPPLRQRPQDIPTLAQHFAAKYSEANGLPRLDVTPQALELLMAHGRSAEHTSELQSLMRNSYAVFCLKKKYKK